MFTATKVGDFFVERMKRAIQNSEVESTLGEMAFRGNVGIVWEILRILWLQFVVFPKFINFAEINKEF